MTDAERWMRRAAALACLGRIGIGSLAMAAPRRTAAIVGAAAEDVEPAFGFAMRSFGVREVAIGALTLPTLRRSPPDGRVLTLNALVDGGDAFAAAAAVVARRRPSTAHLGALSLSLSVTSLWLALRARTRR